MSYLDSALVTTMLAIF